jgi:alanine dehydrogenase
LLAISRQDVEHLLSYEETIQVVEECFRELAAGQVSMPQRIMMPIPNKSGVLAAMPAFLAGADALGIKVASVYQGNPAGGLPAILGVILMLNPATGEPLAIMDATCITAVRTAAASAVATKYMAREDAEVLGVLGSGVQAIAHVRALATIRRLSEIRIFSPNAFRKSAAIEAELGLRAAVNIVGTPREAVANCDIVVLATSSPTPVIDGDWITPGTHLNAIGSHAPHARELDLRTLQRSRVVCDSVDACLAEAGDFLIPSRSGEWDVSAIYGELGEIVTGKKQGREQNSTITLYKSVGLAVQDACVGALVYRKSVERRMGVEFDLLNLDRQPIMSNTRYAGHHPVGNA